jgi:hypothetical protein
LKAGELVLDPSAGIEATLIAHLACPRSASKSIIATVTLRAGVSVR